MDVLPMLEAYARRVGIVENEALIEERF
jgi:hypothetical protein